MPKFAAVASTALCLCAIWSTSASAINMPSAYQTVSAAPRILEDAALICRERCGYYGCRQICVHQPDYGIYEPYGAYSSYGPYEYAGEPWRDRWGHEHEHEHEHWGRYEREREYENED
jgi:hypothetical protein